MRKIIYPVIVSALFASAALAQPSIYFKWKNMETGKTMCNPDADTSKWEKVGGPYEDPNCSFPSK
tara:strand:- start:41 stop:235 length:195 start_codon:yes stop_codon:yes gene_type:complete